MSKEETKPANDEGVLYEIGFHIVPTIAEDKLEEEFNKVESLINSSGGKISTKSEPTLLQLAYTIVKNVDSKNYKYDNAYFAWIKFNAEAEQVTTLKSEMDLNASILRYMIVKTEEGTDITSEAVAASLNGDEEDVEESDKEEKEEEEVEEKVEEPAKEEKQSIDDVDKVIDDMVSEEK